MSGAAGSEYERVVRLAADALPSGTYRLTTVEPTGMSHVERLNRLALAQIIVDDLITYDVLDLEDDRTAWMEAHRG